MIEAGEAAGLDLDGGGNEPTEAGHTLQERDLAQERGIGLGGLVHPPFGVADLALEAHEVVESMACGEAMGGAEFVFLGQQPFLGAVGGPGERPGQIVLQRDPGEVTPFGGQGAGKASGDEGASRAERAAIRWGRRRWAVALGRAVRR